MRFSKSAASDLADIWTYSHDKWGAEQADLYTEQLRAAAESLLTGHGSGRPVAFSAAIRRIKAEHHFIYFRTAADEVLLIRILHERMDPPRHLRDLA